MIHKPALLLFALPILGACTIAGDVVNPPRELKASCNLADAEPVSQNGLVTTRPLCGSKFCS